LPSIGESWSGCRKHSGSIGSDLNLPGSSRRCRHVVSTDSLRSIASAPENDPLRPEPAPPGGGLPAKAPHNGTRIRSVGFREKLSGVTSLRDSSACRSMRPAALVYPTARGEVARFQ